MQRVEVRPLADVHDDDDAVAAGDEGFVDPGEDPLQGIQESRVIRDVPQVLGVGAVVADGLAVGGALTVENVPVRGGGDAEAHALRLQVFLQLQAALLDDAGIAVGRPGYLLQAPPGEGDVFLRDLEADGGQPFFKGGAEGAAAPQEGVEHQAILFRQEDLDQPVGEAGGKHGRVPVAALFGVLDVVPDADGVAQPGLPVERRPSPASGSHRPSHPSFRKEGAGQYRLVHLLQAFIPVPGILYVLHPGQIFHICHICQHLCIATQLYLQLL